MSSNRNPRVRREVDRADVTRVNFEKNLATLGYFTPASKTLRRSTEKTVTVVTTIDGRRHEASVTIMAAPKYGLPGTADQDTYFALLNFATEQRKATGTVQNPISFSAADVFKMQGKVNSGKNYAELNDQLMRLSATTIESRGAVFLARGRKYARNSFHLLERVALIGSEIDGQITERISVWLSQWQLENLNANYFFAVDYDIYRLFTNPIAKGLIPFLHIWLFASRSARVFEKRYDEICDSLKITRYQHVSKVREKLGPALDELVKHEYLSDWRVERTADTRGLKIVFIHGARFRPDQETAALVTDTPPEASSPLLQALLDRGVTERKARDLLAKLPPGQDVARQLEYFDQQVTARPAVFRNPAGFYVHVVENNLPVPASFKTSLQLEGQAELERAKALERQAANSARTAYDRYCLRTAEDHFAALPDAERLRLIETAKDKMRTDPRIAAMLPRWDVETLRTVAEKAAVDQLLNDRVINLRSFSDFSSGAGDQLELLSERSE